MCAAWGWFPVCSMPVRASKTKTPYGVTTNIGAGVAECKGETPSPRAARVPSSSACTMDGVPGFASRGGLWYKGAGWSICCGGWQQLKLDCVSRGDTGTLG
jgi:hypothetical protein